MTTPINNIQQAQVSDNEVLLNAATPSEIKDDPYPALNIKELGNSNLTDNQIAIGQMYANVFMMAENHEFHRLAHMLHKELFVKLKMSMSKGALQQKIFITRYSGMPAEKNIVDSNPQLGVK